MNIKKKCNIKPLLTVKPLGVIFQRPLERELPAPSGQIVQISPKDHSVSFGELRVGPRIQRREATRVSFLDPQCCGVVRRVVRTFRDAHPYSRHVLMSGQVCQVGLKQKGMVIFIAFPLPIACAMIFVYRCLRVLPEEI